MKRCYRCTVEKSLDQFHRDRAKRDGHVSVCADCLNAERRCDKVRAQRRAEHQRNIARIRAYRQQQRIMAPDKISAQKHASYLRCRDRILAKIRTPEHKVRQAQLDAKPARVAKRRAYIKHPLTRGVFVASMKRRLARMRGAESTLTARQWTAIKAAFGGRCAYCRERVTRLEQDHVIPLSKGGSHTLHNVVPACRSCNAKKHTATPPIPVQPLLIIDIA